MAAVRSVFNITTLFMVWVFSDVWRLLCATNTVNIPNYLPIYFVGISQILPPTIISKRVVLYTNIRGEGRVNS
jgi:hypothetical protein